MTLETTRRSALTLGAGALAATVAAPVASATPGETASGSAAPTLSDRRFNDLLSSVPVTAPQLELVMRIVVDIAPSMDLGAAPWGHRFMVPITGGRFTGPGRDGEGISGTVLSGGADRQLLRADGVKELEAVYELLTDDGTVLSVRNLVLSDPRRDPAYKRSTLTIAAPEGRYAWLNRSRFVGTLDSLRPRRQAVLIGAFRVC